MEKEKLLYMPLRYNRTHEIGGKARKKGKIEKREGGKGGGLIRSQEKEEKKDRERKGKVGNKG